MPPFPLFNNHLCCHFLPHPSSWRTAPHCCKTLRSAKHSCTSLYLLSLLFFVLPFLFVSVSVCACVSMQCAHKCIYTVQCINVCISWPRSSLIQNCVFVSVWVPVFLLCVFLGYALVCVCACVSDCIPMGLSLNVLFESLCACVLHAAMWSCVPAFCLQTCIPKTSRGALAQVCVCVNACLSVCTHLLDNTVQGVHAKLSLSFVCVCVILFISVSVSQPVHLSIWFYFPSVC